MTDPLALALRELRGSLGTDAAGHDDAEDADTLRSILARLGLSLVPAEGERASDAGLLIVSAERLSTMMSTETDLRAQLALAQDEARSFQALAAALLDVERAALALARSEEQMRMALAGEDAGNLFEPWPEADALVAALKASGAEKRHA